MNYKQTTTKNIDENNISLLKFNSKAFLYRLMS